MQPISSETFCGQLVRKKQISEIKEIIDTFPRLTRTELANTICELFSWKRPTGKLKTVECLQFIEHLDDKGIIHLPEIKKRRPKGVKTKIRRTRQSKAQPAISEKLCKLTPILLIRVESKEQRQLWYEYVDRYHYLGYQVPFGAQLRYFINAGGRKNAILGCMQFSSPAWTMAPRDRWIGWNEEQRKRNLQRIINNSRFLILPWVKVKNLASSVLALAARTVLADWQRVYGYRPVLLETLVDQKRFKGTCYKAAGPMWALQQAEDGWTGRTSATDKPLKKFTSIPWLQDFAKRCILFRGDAQWDCLLIIWNQNVRRFLGKWCMRKLTSG